MQRHRGLLVLTGAATLAVGAFSAPAHGERGLLVGVDDDTAKWMARPNGLLATYRDLGLGAVRVTIPWRQGRTRPTPVGGLYLHRVERGQLAPFLARLGRASRLREAPGHLLGPAPRPTPGCERDQLDGRPLRSGRLHRRGGQRLSRQWTRPPARRHVRPQPVPRLRLRAAWTTHDDPSDVGEGDLDRLLAAIGSGFLGTSQPLPGLDQSTTVWYLEDGFQTAVPRSKRRFYSGLETDRSVLSAWTSGGEATGTRDQSTQLRDALTLAFCQPAVGAFFNFELIDEDRLGGWQSGLLWRDGTHKPAYDAYKSTIAELRADSVDCSRLPGAPTSQPG